MTETVSAISWPIGLAGSLGAIVALRVIEVRSLTGQFSSATAQHSWLPSLENGDRPLPMGTLPPLGRRGGGRRKGRAGDLCRSSSQ